MCITLINIMLKCYLTLTLSMRVGFYSFESTSINTAFSIHPNKQITPEKCINL